MLRRGCRQAAEAAGITFKTYFANADGRSQSEQVETALADKPDLLILNPENAAESVAWFRAINEAGIPVIASNFLPLPESFRYILAWTGPDDWGQSRLLARKFAELLGSSGGYSLFRHLRGSSSYYARTFDVLTELKKFAPCMGCLSIEQTDLDEETAYVAALHLIQRENSKIAVEKTMEWMGELSIDIIGCIAANRKKQTLIQKVIESVEHDQTNRVSLKVLSHRFDISRIYLGQLFKKETGKSFTQYINERRVESAKKLFRSTSLEANEIAAMVGYFSANYFYKVFKKYAGVHPSEYIEPFKGGAEE